MVPPPPAASRSRSSTTGPSPCALLVLLADHCAAAVAVPVVTRPSVLPPEQSRVFRGDGAYIVTGNGDSAEVHNPRFDFNDAAIPHGAGVLAAVVESKLKRVE